MALFDDQQQQEEQNQLQPYGVSLVQEQKQEVYNMYLMFPSIALNCLKFPASSVLNFVLTRVKPCIQWTTSPRTAHAWVETNRELYFSSI